MQIWEVTFKKRKKKTAAEMQHRYLSSSFSVIMNSINLKILSTLPDHGFQQLQDIN